MRWVNSYVTLGKVCIAPIIKSWKQSILGNGLWRGHNKHVSLSCSLVFVTVFPFFLRVVGNVPFIVSTLIISNRES